jgi:hypothetical protein
MQALVRNSTSPLRGMRAGLWGPRSRLEGKNATFANPTILVQLLSVSTLTEHNALPHNRPLFSTRLTDEMPRVLLPLRCKLHYNNCRAPRLDAQIMITG